MTQQLKELAEQMLKLQQVVKMLSDNVNELKRGTDIDIRVLNDAVADVNDSLDFEHGRIDRVMSELEPIKAHLDRPSDYMRRVKQADKLCAKVWSPEELAEDMKKRRV
tara:strand:+ start:382 stop:705 length:324 start_codon:yes stop_codon:yes gene_type:complete